MTEQHDYQSGLRNDALDYHARTHFEKGSDSETKSSSFGFAGYSSSSKSHDAQQQHHSENEAFVGSKSSREQSTNARYGNEARYTAKSYCS